MSPYSIFFSTTPFSTTLTFRFSDTPAYSGTPLVRKSDGTTLSGTWSLNGIDLTFVSEQSVSLSDFLIVESDGTWLSGDTAKYYIGGKGDSRIDMSQNSDIHYDDRTVAFGNDGNDTIIGTTRGYDFLYAGEGRDTLIDQGGGAMIDLSETYPMSDAIIIAHDPINTAGPNVRIIGFDVSSKATKITTNDTLSLNSNVIASNTTKGDGEDVGFIKTHTISKGAVTFVNVPIQNDSLYQDALDYLYLNLKVGENVVFEVETETFSGSILYEKGVNPSQSVIVEFEGSKNLALGTKSGLNTVHLSDYSAPILMGAVIEGNQVKLQYSEAIKSIKTSKNLIVSLNGTDTVSKIKVLFKGNDLLFTSKTLMTGANDSVEILLDQANNYTLSDKNKNSIQWSSINDTLYSTLIVGSEGINTLDLITRASAVYVSGNGGDDVISSTGYNDTLYGGSGNDALYGLGGSDTLEGGEGADVLDGGAGADRLVGGSGDDLYVIDNPDDQIFELLHEGGIDTVKSALTTYILGENLENLIINTASATFVSGNGLDNIIYSGSSDDNINGLEGDDTVSYELSGTGVSVDLSVIVQQDTKMGKDTLASIENIIGSGFKDELSGDSGDNILFGGGEDDILQGGEGDDIIDGGTDNKGDELDGGDGVDTVSYLSASLGVRVDLSNTDLQNTGGGGYDTLSHFENIVGSYYDDTLCGQSGTLNILSGGSGNDRFFVNSTSVIDTIADFGIGNDRIVLDGTLFGSVSYLSYSNGTVYYDEDGSGSLFAPVAFLTVIGTFDLSKVSIGVF